MTSLSGPQGYVQARNEAMAMVDGNSSSSSLFVRTVENRPYFPLLKVDPSNEATVIEIAKVILASLRHNNDIDSAGKKSNGTANDIIPDNKEEGKVTIITGGLTNALFKVDLPSYHLPTFITNTTPPTISVLVRIFGAEGMINRDEETAIFARLCDPKGGAIGSGSVVHNQLDLLGRFRNGRVETWIPNMRQAHHVDDLGRQEGLVMEVARQLARLHYGYDATAVVVSAAGSTLKNRELQQPPPSLWKVTESWTEELSQCLSHDKFRDDAVLMELFSRAATAISRQHDEPSSETHDITAAKIKALLSDELAWLKDRVETRFPHAPIVFCHNDVNAANILLDTSIDDNESENNKSYDRQSVCIIDYEYGSINYAMYDVANFNCEHCGGLTNGIPNYELLPRSARIHKFLEEYVRERDEILLSTTNINKDAGGGGTTTIATVSDLHSQVELFEMASNLYWGVWGVLQAAGEVTDGTFRMENAESRLGGVSDLDAWDNLRYAKNRLERYRVCKEGVLRNDLS